MVIEVPDYCFKQCLFCTFPTFSILFVGEDEGSELVAEEVDGLEGEDGMQDCQLVFFLYGDNNTSNSKLIFRVCASRRAAAAKIFNSPNIHRSGPPSSLSFPTLSFQHSLQFSFCACSSKGRS